MRDERLEWIDAAKGFGMVLVVLGHMSIPQAVSKVIFSFHMPLFFMISGYLYHGGFSRRWVAGKIDSLLISYLVYGVIIISVWRVIGKQGGVDSWLMGNGIGVTWFLMCLFWTEVVGAVVLRFIRIPLFVIVAIVCASMIGAIVPHFCPVGVMMVRSLFAAVAFWLFGSWLRAISFFQMIDGVSKPLLRFLVAILLGLSLLALIQRVDMASGDLGNPLLFYFTGTASSVLVLMAFHRYEMLKHLTVLKFIGSRTLEFMHFHTIIPSLVTLVMASFLPKAFQRIVCIGLVVAFSWVAHRFVPILSGRALVIRRWA